MKKILLAISVCLLAAGVAQASVVEFRNLGGAAEGTVAVDGVVAGTITSAANGDDLIYSFSVSGVDLDGGGTATDSMSWDVRFEAFTGSSYASGELTLGSSAQASTAPTSEFDVGAGTTTWKAGESLRFSIENVQLTAAAGYAATFNGFTGFWLTAGDYYLGTGVDTTVITTGANTDYAFDPAPLSLILTAQASERNRNLDGNFTIAIPEPGTLGLIAFTGVGLITIRRFMLV